MGRLVRVDDAISRPLVLGSGQANPVSTAPSEREIPLKTMTLRVFQREIARQCQFALISVDLRDGALRELGQPRQDNLATNQLWYSLQGFLISAANISKLLWGTKMGTNAETWKKRQSERLHLRSTLRVADNSILKLSPHFRDHFEHLDERIEDWTGNSARHNLVEDLIGSTGMIGGIDVEDFFRSYDPEAKCMCFRGETFEIEPVALAISNLLPIAAEQAARPHWDEFPNESASTGGGGR